MGALSSRVTGIAGLIFVIFTAIGITIAFDQPDTDAPDQKWLDYARDDSNLFRNIAGGYLIVIAAIAFIVFLIGMYQLLNRLNEGGGWALVMVGSGVAWAASLAIGAILIDTIPGAIEFGSAPEPTAETARWMGQVGFGVMLAAGGLFAAFTTAVTSGLILKTKALPGWLGYFGFLAAIAMCAAAVFVPMIIYGLWMLALGVVLVLRGDQVPAAATA